MRDRLLRLRAWRPSPAAVHRAFLLALVANAGIVVTGGAVRLTASGLGCPEVPRCTDTSLVPTAEMGAHGVIEFGNRMLTFVLTAAVVGALLTAVRARRRDLTRAAALLVAGVAVQALLGAVTVLTELNPLTVMAHFLLSMVLVAIAVRALDAASPSGGEQVVAAAPAVRLGSWALVAAAAATLAAGTVVTGTGPHSGDDDATDRLPFDLATVTQLHADLVFLLLGLTVGMLVAVHASQPARGLATRVRVLLAVLLLQGGVGYAQYVTDLPVLLVGVHILGATLVWIAAVRVLTHPAQSSSEPVPASSLTSKTGAPPEPQVTRSSTSPDSERNLARASRAGPGR